MDSYIIDINEEVGAACHYPADHLLAADADDDDEGYYYYYNGVEAEGQQQYPLSDNNNIEFDVDADDDAAFMREYYQGAHGVASLRAQIQAGADHCSASSDPFPDGLPPRCTPPEGKQQHQYPVTSSDNNNNDFYDDDDDDYISDEDNVNIHV